MGKKQSERPYATPEQPPPKPQNNFTKWITRIVALLLLAATFTWLDGIKVSYYSNSSTASSDLDYRIGGMF
jgi:C-8 sterol isomerase